MNSVKIEITEIQKKSASQTGGWCVELEEVCMLKESKALVETWSMDIAAGQGKVVAQSL